MKEYKNISEWKQDVIEIAKVSGYTPDQLPKLNYTDLFESGVSAVETAAKAIEKIEAAKVIDEKKWIQDFGNMRDKIAKYMDKTKDKKVKKALQTSMNGLGKVIFEIQQMG